MILSSHLQLRCFLFAQWIVHGCVGDRDTNDGQMRRGLGAEVTKAVYDPTHGAPRCLNPSTSCDTGKLLVGVGNDGGGRERNSNTIDDCSDASDGIYEQDESVDRIVVRSKDGSLLKSGSEAIIEAIVRTATDTSDRQPSRGVEVAHFYYATNLSSTVDWTYIDTRYAFPNSGSQMFTCVYTLPEGEVQAVRVNYGYNEYIEGPCASIGGFTDVDDVLFAVVDCTQEDCTKVDPLSMPSLDTMAPTQSLMPSSSSQPSVFPSISSAPSTSLAPSTMPTEQPHESTWWDELWPFPPLSSSSIRTSPLYSGLQFVMFSMMLLFLS